MNVIDVAITRLKEYENNPRNNELAVEKVKSSIKRFGFLFPVIIDINYVIICGHTRVSACKELGIQTVPCIIADELTEEQINLFRLVDNKTSEYSDWDFYKLKKELALIDLTVEENNLILEQFDLTAEVLDLESEVSEIRVPSANFTDVSDKKKSSVSTINSVKNVDSKEDEFKDLYEEDEEDNNFADEDLSDDNSMNSELADNDDEPKEEKTQPLLSMGRFRFGDVNFYISKVELDKLNEKYADFIEMDLISKMSFVDYLLKGLKKL